MKGTDVQCMQFRYWGKTNFFEVRYCLFLKLRKILQFIYLFVLMTKDTSKMFSFKVQEIGLLKKAPLPTQLCAIPCSHCKLLLQELLEAY